jgi:curved DNA-binding protein CbpA
MTWFTCASAFACVASRVRGVEASTTYEFIHYARNDFYGALDVARDANSTVIAKKYRKLALSLHPDKLPKEMDRAQRQRAKKHFEVIAEAKKILLDETLRKEYDDVIASLPKFARPKFGKRSAFDKEEVKFSAWLVMTVFAVFCVSFASVAQYTSREADKQSLMQSAFYLQKLKSRNKNVPKPDRVTAEQYFDEFLVEFGLTDLTGWEHTTGGKLLARLRGRIPASETVEAEETTETSDASASASGRDSDNAVTSLRRRGKKKGKNKGRQDGGSTGGAISAERRAATALKHLRSEGEARRMMFGDSYDIE